MTWENKDDLVWPHDVPWFELITPAFSNNSKWTTFSNPTQFKEMPMLVGWVGAQDARDIEAQTDDEILDDVMSNLKSMFPSISRPDKVFITRWGRDLNILGAYSFQKLKRNFANDSTTLGKSIDHKLWFAGEATAGEMHGTTEGAWESGMKAGRQMAEEILRRVQNDPKQSTIHPLATDCTASRKIPTEEDWQFLRDAYNKVFPPPTGEDWQFPSGFLVPYEIRDVGPRGRSVYATEFIPKGRKIYEGMVPQVEKQSDFTNFLRLLPHDLQCDIILWAFAGDGDTAYLVLDEGAFVNHGETPELVNLDPDCRTLRDIHPGEELLQDYGEYINPNPGWFNDIRERAWGAEPYLEQGATK